MNILYGDVIAEAIKTELKTKFHQQNLKLAIIVASDDFGSKSYRRQIVKLAKELEVETIEVLVDETIQESELINKITTLNNDPTITGILIQRPLPKQLNSQRIIESLASDKDVEGLHPYNLGRLLSGQTTMVPCTAKAVMKLVDYYQIPLSGKNVVIIGRSPTVGKPLAVLMTDRNATVTLCHTKTEALFSITKKADIIVTAIGCAEFFDETYFSENSIVIDVGINWNKEGITGDVDYHKVVNLVKAITPVPKGVGSLTTVLLFENLSELKERRK